MFFSILLVVIIVNFWCNLLVKSLTIVKPQNLNYLRKKKITLLDLFHTNAKIPHYIFQAWWTWEIKYQILGLKFWQRPNHFHLIGLVLAGDIWNWLKFLVLVCFGQFWLVLAKINWKSCFTHVNIINSF